MKAMKFFCCLFMGMMMTALVGCSDDEKDSSDYEFDWKDGPADYTIERLCLRKRI